MTKKDIVEKVAAETNFSQREVGEILQRSLDVMQEGLANGESVHFRGFGIFHILKRKPRIGRNPKKPEETVKIPAQKTVKFKPGQTLKALMSAGTEE